MTFFSCDESRRKKCAITRGRRSTQARGLHPASLKIAQLRYDPEARQWSLYCRDRNERWWPYRDIPPSTSVDPLLAELDADPTGIFWG